ncbi:TlpA disulfide reductase family protein [Saccharothrix xinjiangensis]|uniref:TlpA family protein disulfide reductase n=1 Tax=Saccharothrix xinjiangensis TaxID=204798 RepID=A0ABV9Y1H8_9PSEU
MSARARWAVVVLVLVVAGVVALWPRGSDPVGAGPPSRSAPDLGPLRERAGLPPCAGGPGGTPGGPAGLRGLTATCLGDGAPVDLAAALPGRALVNFWATWCVPCQEELKVLDAYSREPGAAQVLAVLVASKEGDGLELLAKLGVRLPAVHDPADAARRALRVPPRLPVSYVVGEDGSLTEVAEPLVFESVEQVREVVG